MSDSNLIIGGVVALININATDINAFNSKFKNNTVAYLIHSLNNKNTTVIDNLTVIGTDFSAYNVNTVNVKKDIDTNASILSGVFNNLKLSNLNIENVKASRNSSLFEFTLTGNFTLEKSEFKNLQIPYGLLEIYNNNKFNSSWIINSSRFINITPYYNMSYYDWDGEDNVFIWQYGRGASRGIYIFTGYNETYGRFNPCDLTFTNLYFDNVNGEGKYIYLESRNCNITNYTMVNSKTGCSPMGEYALGLYLYATGDVTLKDILQDNMTTLDYNITGYDYDLKKYLTKEYISFNGGAGIMIVADGNVDAYNINITNSEISDHGMISLEGNNVSCKKILLENNTESTEVKLDKYYADLDLQTYKFNTGRYGSSGLYVISTERGEISNILANNLIVTGDSIVCAKSDYNVSCENITVINSHFGYGYEMIEIYGAENANVKNILIENVDASFVVNSSSYNYNLGRYIWEYSDGIYSAPSVSVEGGNAILLNLSIINSKTCGEELLSVYGDNVTLNQILIDNIARYKIVNIKYDEELDEYLNSSYYTGGYDGGIVCNANHNMNITNTIISNCVSSQLGIMFETIIRDYYGKYSDYYFNIENVTIANITPLDTEYTFYDKQLGDYFTEHQVMTSYPVIQIAAPESDDVSSVLNITNMLVDNLRGFSNLINLDANEIYV